MDPNAEMDDNDFTTEELKDMVDSICEKKSMHDDDDEESDYNIFLQTKAVKPNADERKEH